MPTKRTKPDRPVRRYGWKPDVPDARDLVMRAAPRATRTPPRVSLRISMPSVWDQGELGSCTANAIGACHQFEQMKKGSSFMPSRLFIYFNERRREGTVDIDNGAMIRTGIKSVNKEGACPESEWGYRSEFFTTEPKPLCYREALNTVALQYLRVPRTASQIESVLAGGRPFVCGISIYESFESKVGADGMVSMPGKGEALLGGHAVTVIGYDRAKKLWEVRNSWGPDWGDAGHFWLPYQYLLDPNLSDDFWVIKAVGPAPKEGPDQ